jgi:hypothetical protein
MAIDVAPLAAAVHPPPMNIRTGPATSLTMICSFSRAAVFQSSAPPFRRRGVAELFGDPFVEGADVMLVRYEHATVRVEP